MTRIANPESKARIGRDPEERRARALGASRKMREVSVARGNDRMTLKDIKRLIAKARRS